MENCHINNGGSLSLVKAYISLSINPIASTIFGIPLY